MRVANGTKGLDNDEEQTYLAQRWPGAACRRSFLVPNIARIAVIVLGFAVAAVALAQWSEGNRNDVTDGVVLLGAIALALILAGAVATPVTDPNHLPKKTQVNVTTEMHRLWLDRSFVDNRNESCAMECPIRRSYPRHRPPSATGLDVAVSGSMLPPSVAVDHCSWSSDR